jgi:hypothetical protein
MGPNVLSELGSFLDSRHFSVDALGFIFGPPLYLELVPHVMLGALTFVSTGWQLARQVFYSMPQEKSLPLFKNGISLSAHFDYLGRMVYFLATFSFQKKVLKGGLIACLLSNVWGLF